MRSTPSTASVAVGGLVLLCLPALAQAQGALQIQAVSHVASLSPGTILGVVQDEKGVPVAGATVSALGTTTAMATTDRNGRFELRTLSPGPYLVRAHLSGFIAPRGQIVEVRPSARATSSIALRHSVVASTTAPLPVLAAGVGGAPDSAAPPDAVATTESAGSAGNDDHSEMAWRLRHARRSVLKDATLPDGMLRDEGSDGFGQRSLLERAGASRLAANFFATTPFSGQVNLLTTGSFDSPQQFFTSNSFSHSIAYLALGAPVGEHADWTARAALTQGAIASWIVAGEYTTRAPARHRYDIGLSYSTQRYDGGNFAGLQGVTDGSRSAGALYAFDTYSITPEVTLTYGGRYARYDYLDGESLLSPRVALTVEPIEHFRISGVLSHRAVAPGAEEFMPRMDTGIWLPPQRTFSALVSGRPLEAERSTHMEVEVERDVALATVTLRAFHQHVADQLLTLFGVDMPGTPTAGHYFLSNAGDADASGMSAGLRAAFAHRVHGSVEYSITNARLGSSDDRSTIVRLAPSAIRLDADRIHDFATSIETEVPETSTRVVVLYRVGNGFSRPAGATTGATDRPALDSRFDIQVRQALPFMDFSNAKWEMLLAVRNFFRETAPDQSVYDELLVVRPPKRIVGGLTLKF
jgi:TonB dependent receptor/Carboxypeptidase regulatory-like domain